jgi:hypothetical protein
LWRLVGVLGCFLDGCLALGLDRLGRVGILI